MILALALALLADPGLDHRGNADPKLASMVCRDVSIRVFKDFTNVRCRADQAVHVFSIRRDYPNKEPFIELAFEARRHKAPITVTYYVDPDDNQTACLPENCRAIYSMEIN